MSCIQLYETILTNKTLLKKEHSSAEYKSIFQPMENSEIHIGYEFKMLYFNIYEYTGKLKNIIIYVLI